MENWINIKDRKPKEGQTVTLPLMGNFYYINGKFYATTIPAFVSTPVESELWKPYPY